MLTRHSRTWILCAFFLVADGCEVPEPGLPSAQGREGEASGAAEQGQGESGEPSAEVNFVERDGVTARASLSPGDGTLRIYCRSEGRSVTAESRVVLVREEPTADGSLAEIDVRAVSDMGVTFATSAGGHGLIDPEWTAAADSAGDLAGNQSMGPWFRLAARCGEVAGDLESSLVTEHGEQFSRATEFLESLGEPTLLDSVAPPPEGEQVPTVKVAVTYYRKLTIRYKTALWPYNWTETQHFSHSATRMALLQRTGTGPFVPAVPYATRDTCNHGTCYSAMTNTMCSTPAVGPVGTSLPGSSGSCGTSASTIGAGNCCTTDYRPTSSYRDDDGGHVCNDDTRRQVDAFSSVSSSTYCSDTTLALSVPSCGTWITAP